MSARRMFAPLCAVLLAGCPQAAAGPVPRVLSRPSDVGFVCFEWDGAQLGAPVPLEGCAHPTDPDQFAPGRALVALIPQEVRGEVGAINLSTSPALPLDSDPRVPGYTFFGVGEVPNAIAVSPLNGRCAFVSNRGSRTVEGIPTVCFRGLAGECVPSFSSMLAGAPEDLALVEDLAPAGTQPVSGSLYVAIPDQAQVLRFTVDLDTCALIGEAEAIDLPTMVPPGPAPGTPYDAPERPDRPSLNVEAYAECPATVSGTIAAVPASAGLAPPPDPLPPARPTSLALSADRTTLWVGDEALPVVHAIVDGALDPSRSVRADGPVSAIAVTPPVPTPGGDRAYIYAIAARDGGVMVIDLSTGQVVPVASASYSEPDRIPLTTRALSLGVIQTRDAPLVPEQGVLEQACQVAPAAEINVLRGVFVAIGLADGTVRIVDVYDRDAPCYAAAVWNASADACSTRIGSGQRVFQRHRPRIGVRTVEDGLVDQSPRLTYSNTIATYDASGQAGTDPTRPRLEERACPAGLTGVFPMTGQRSRICAITDPWSAVAESVAISWEGAIPFADTTAGALVIPAAPNEPARLSTPDDLCALGVLGPDGAPPGSPEAGFGADAYAGDLVAFAGALPAATRDDPACRELVGLALDVRFDAPRARILAIERGDDPFDTELVLARELEQPAGRLIDEVYDCYLGELVSFQVRARQHYVVSSTRAPFSHRVIRLPDGSCAVDLTQDARLNGRAWPGQPFENWHVAFQLGGAIPPPNAPVDITFTLSDASPLLAADLGNLTGANAATLVGPIAHLAIDRLDERLYVVEQMRRGLVVFDLTQFRVLRFIE